VSNKGQIVDLRCRFRQRGVGRYEARVVTAGQTVVRKGDFESRKDLEKALVGHLRAEETVHFGSPLTEEPVS